MIIYKFRMLSDESDNFVRDYEVPATLTLLELHNFILETLEYDPCVPSFYTADAKWEKLEEFTAIDMGTDAAMSGVEESLPRPMASVALCDVMHYMHDRLIYNFDLFAARSYFLELIDAKDGEDSMNYPRESFAHAEAPDQYDPDISVEDGSIFEEMMGDFGGYDNDEEYEDEY